MRKYAIITMAVAMVYLALATGVFSATSDVPANSTETTQSNAVNGGSSFPGHSFEPVW